MNTPYGVAIVTKYLGPTDTLGARISAKSVYGSVTIGYDHIANTGWEAHSRAAVALCKKKGWVGTLSSGVLPGGGFVWTFVTKNDLEVGS